MMNSIKKWHSQLSFSKAIIVLAHLSIMFAFFPSVSVADCPQNDFENASEGNAKLLRRIKPDGLVAAQGITTFFRDGSEKIALASGYWQNNALIIDLETGQLDVQKNLSQTAPSQLLASVHNQSNLLWWTSYREDKIYSTDETLQNTNSVEMPSLHSVVGISGLKNTGHIVLPNRNPRHDIYLLDEKNLIPPQKLKLNGLTQAPYDVDVYRGCIFLVESSFGQIWTLEEKELLQVLDGHKNLPQWLRWFADNVGWVPSVKPHLWFENSKRIQHLQIKDGRLAVIDTDAHQIISIFLDNGTVQKFNLPFQNIFRGLAVTSKGTVLLTGFEDEKDTSENRTAIFEFELKDDF